MKTTLKYIFVILIYLNLFFVVFGQEEKTYCDAWKAGYIAGYCSDDLFCIEPVVPVCPIPKLGLDKYKHGYLRGVKAGEKKAANP
jgi:hypothetical protein